MSLFRSMTSRLRRRAADDTLRRSVEIKQKGTRLVLAVELGAGARAEQLWLRSPQETWLPLGRMRLAATDSATGVSRFEAEIDLAEALGEDYLDSCRGEALPDDLAETQEQGIKLNLFLDVLAPSRALEAKTQSIDVWERPGEGDEPRRDPVPARLALGRFAKTSLSGLAPVSIGESTVYAYPSKFGNMLIAVDSLPRRYNRVHVSHLGVEKGRLRIRGRMLTRHSEVDSASILLTGRSTGQTFTVPVAFQEDATASQARYGHRRYEFSADYDLTELLRVPDAVDDVLDAWMLTVMPEAAEPHRARIGRTRYLVRRRTTEGWAEHSGRVVLLSPYYTAKAKRTSFYLEFFDAEAFTALRNGLMRKPAAHRTSTSPRPVWLIGEMNYKAQDTGLAFFAYMRRNHPEIDAYYVIDPSSPDYRNLEGLDNVVAYRSPEHIDLIFQAERVIGSHHPDYLYPSRSRALDRTIDPVKIFLQHGVMAIKRMEHLYGRDSSSFDTDVFIVSSEREKEYIVSDFGYRPEEVAVTGLSRFDTLFDGSITPDPKQILIMPTWREWLQDEQSFLESEYFRQWNELLGSPELHRALETHRAHIVFYLHPNMRQYMHHFADAPVRTVQQGEVDLQRLLKESGVLITDYSSVGWDFSFLHKPAFYYHFDAERALRHGAHIDLDQELPGPAHFTAGSLINDLDRVLAKGSQMAPEYVERAERFIVHRDQENSARIFETVKHARHRAERRLRIDPEAIASAKRVARRRRQYMPAMKRFYRAAKVLPVNERCIVFEAGLGRQFNDSPRRIYEELVRRGDTRTKVWVHPTDLNLSDPHTKVVPKYSPEYFWYLATAKYWISNQNLPHYITRRKDGVYLQTWHGTPLKRMLHDLPEIHGRDEGYKHRVTTAIAQWTHLLSPSPFATKAFASAFRHRAAVIEAGYPRNDVLNAPDRERMAQKVRAQLQVPAGKKTVLYAPTFRDDLPASAGRFYFAPPFRIEEIQEALGEDYVLLVRLHVVIKNRLVIPEEYAGKIIDVTRYPDINDLFLASDVLVTDYSSAFFDYALLKRPIVFFAYDLAKYRDELRGFYLDFPEDLPGPVVETVEALARTIRRSGDADESSDRAEFLTRFAPHDDGRAAERVVDELFGEA